MKKQRKTKDNKEQRTNNKTKNANILRDNEKEWVTWDKKIINL